MDTRVGAPSDNGLAVEPSRVPTPWWKKKNGEKSPQNTKVAIIRPAGPILFRLPAEMTFRPAVFGRRTGCFVYGKVCRGDVEGCRAIDRFRFSIGFLLSWWMACDVALMQFACCMKYYLCQSTWCIWYFNIKKMRIVQLKTSVCVLYFNCHNVSFASNVVSEKISDVRS